MEHRRPGKLIRATVRTLHRVLMKEGKFSMESGYGVWNLLSLTSEDCDSGHRDAAIDAEERERSL
jgi:hypothetical protein